MCPEELDAWEKPDVECVHAALAQVGRPWWIAGGLALSLFADREIRPHHDVDVVILDRHATEFRRALASWDVRAAIGWSGPPRASRRILRPWPSNEPRPQDTSAFWCRPAPGDPWRFELLINPATDGRWEFKRDRSLTRPLAEIGSTRDGTPFLMPELVLLHKATSSPVTARDTADLSAVLSSMAPSQRLWLAQAITRFSPDHPWLARLSEAP